jgi:LDH2 family malate/lactate/ureidoglycolate dehydrogenase
MSQVVEVRTKVSDLAAFIALVLESVGLPKTDAQTVAALMAEADARGSDGHGVLRLPAYVKRIQAGGLNVNPNIRVLRDEPGTALLDGDNAMGHLVMSRAANLAIEKARSCGIGWVGACNSNHAGPAALYARMPLAHDMIGLYIAIGNANHLPPWGGTAMLLSTNPIAIAVPGLRHPSIVLDMATTNAAFGKVKVKAQRNEQMPEGWMIDREGKPLTDPKKAHEGFLLPVGGAKGYGLALMFGLLAGTLNGAAFGKNVIDFNADFVSRTNTGHLVAALNIAAFADVQTFKQNVDDIWEQMKSSPTMPGFDEVRLPGERSGKIYVDHMANGIVLAQALRQSLDELADRLHVERL